jgi:hypothetical protein
VALLYGLQGKGLNYCAGADCYVHICMILIIVLYLWMTGGSDISEQVVLVDFNRRG